MILLASWTLARVEGPEGGQAAVRCRVVTDATLARANQPEEQAEQPDLPTSGCSAWSRVSLTEGYIAG